MLKIKYKIIILFFTLSHISCDTPCKPIKKEHGIVCVCNEEYCDTIPPIEPAPKGEFLKFTSNKAGLRFHKENGQFQKSTKLNTLLRINSEKRYQNIFGWGGAFTDATGINVNSLGANAREHLIKSYFSDVGIGYNLCRIPIGSTDFSTRSYTYDDQEFDTTLANYKLASEDFQLRIPLIQEALEMTNNSLKLFASAWSAPEWLKSNATWSVIREDMFQTWADYFLKFLEAYHELGIEIWGLTTGNEPTLAMLPSNREISVGWLPGRLSQWIVKNLGPTLRKSKLFSNIKILSIDDQRFMYPWFAKQMVDYNNETMDYVDGFSVHWYSDWVFPATLLDEVHESFPETFILMSEACNGDTTQTLLKDEGHVMLGSWSRGEEYSADIIENLQHWVSGWVDWNMALDLEGGPTYVNNNVDSPIIVNKTSGEFYKQPTFYHMGHFSKFIPEGSVRIGVEEIETIDVSMVAVQRPDGGKVAVFLNKNDTPVSISISDETRGIINLDLSQRSITTIIYW